MNYVGQKDGEVILLTNEIPGFIFTEDDRRIAKQAIKESREDKGMDLQVAQRLYELITVGKSHQAEVLLSELVVSSYDTKEIDI